MDNLDRLIKYWESSYGLNFTTRTPQTNDKIIATINYLKELREIKRR